MPKQSSEMHHLQSDNESDWYLDPRTLPPRSILTPVNLTVDIKQANDLRAKIEIELTKEAERRKLTAIEGARQPDWLKQADEATWKLRIESEKIAANAMGMTRDEVDQTFQLFYLHYFRNDPYATVKKGGETVKIIVKPKKELTGETDVYFSSFQDLEKILLRLTGLVAYTKLAKISNKGQKDAYIKVARSILKVLRHQLKLSKIANNTAINPHSIHDLIDKYEARLEEMQLERFADCSDADFLVVIDDNSPFYMAGPHEENFDLGVHSMTNGPDPRIHLYAAE